MKIVKNHRPLPTPEENAEWEAKTKYSQTVNVASAEPPVLTEIAMSVKVTIPLMQYGNIEMFVSQKAMVHDTPEDRESATLNGLNRLKRHIAEIVLPLVEAEVQRGLPELLRQSNPDTWMQIKNPTYRWLRVAQPDMMIPAMEAVIMDEDRIASVTK